MKTKSKLLTVIPKPLPKMTVEPLSKYQADGIIEGKVKAVGDSFRVQIGSHEYKLVVDKHKKRSVRTLVEQSDEPIVMKVCPHQYKDKDLQFTLYKVITERPAQNTINRFILRGIWQYLQSNKRPMFSIYRNQLRSQNDCYRPKHLWVIWDGQPAHHYGETSAHFSQIIAKLDPLSGNLVFESEIAPPSPAVPYKCFRFVSKPKLKIKIKTIELVDPTISDA
jgi:hypothetical protein